MEGAAASVSSAAPSNNDNTQNGISQLPPSAASAAKSALEAAMTEVSTGAAPGSSARKRATSSASSKDAAATATTTAANGTEEREEGEVSQDLGSSATNGISSNGAEEIRTVFQDPDNFNVKHPLASRWTLWFDNPSQKGLIHTKNSKGTWGEDLNKVVDIDSVEEFWGLYHNIIPPSQLPPKANYYLFKEGIQPAWEDEANAKGGKWSVHFPREKSRDQIDTLWLYTMLSAIGETLDAPYPVGPPHAQAPGEPELITGVIMAARPNYYRLAIWTRKADTESDEITSRLMDIGKHFKVNVLGFKLEDRVASNYGTEVEFQSHTESEKKKGKKTVL